MEMTEILKELDAEISKLQQVRKLLSNTSSLAMDDPAGTQFTATRKTRRKRRTLSAEARKKIADAQRKRWAAEKAKK